MDGSRPGACSEDMKRIITQLEKLEARQKQCEEQMVASKDVAAPRWGGREETRRDHACYHCGGKDHFIAMSKQGSPGSTKLLWQQSQKWLDISVCGKLSPVKLGGRGLMGSTRPETKVLHDIITEQNKADITVTVSQIKEAESDDNYVWDSGIYTLGHVHGRPTQFLVQCCS